MSFERYREPPEETLGASLRFRVKGGALRLATRITALHLVACQS